VTSRTGAEGFGLAALAVAFVPLIVAIESVLSR
jgi:hypothetical protein